MLAYGWASPATHRTVRLFAVALVAFTIPLLTAHTAAADELCVGAATGCVSTFNYPGTGAGLQQALDDAASVTHPIADTVHVAAGAYESATGFTIDLAGSLGITIVGAGAGATVLRATGAAIESIGTTGQTNPLAVRDLTVQSNVNLAGALAIDISGHVSLHDASVQCFMSPCTGLAVASPGYATVVESGFGAMSNGSTGVALSGTSSMDSTFTNTEFSGFETAIDSTDRNVVVRSSMFDLGSATGAVAVSLEVSSATSDRTAKIDGSTVIGDGINQVGLGAFNDSATSDSILFARSTAFDLSGWTAVPFECEETDAGVATITTISSAFDTAAVDDCTESHTTPLDIEASPPKYFDRARRDLRQIYGSSLIDRGEPSSGAMASYGLYDMLGRTRRRGTNYDIGALEYQHSTPKITGDISYSRSGRLDNDLIASVAVSDADFDQLQYAWTIDREPVAGGSSISTVLSYAKQSFSALLRVTVTDPTGLSDEASLYLKVHPVPIPKLTLLSPPNRPVKSTVKKRFAVTQTRPTGPRFALQLNTDAALEITFQRILPGHIDKRKRCDLSGKTKRGKRCFGYKMLVRPTFQASLVEGEVWIAVGGRIGRSRLRPGLYYVRMKATGESGRGSQMFQIRLR